MANGALPSDRTEQEHAPCTAIGGSLDAGKITRGVAHAAQLDTPHDWRAACLKHPDLAGMRKCRVKDFEAF